MYYTVIKHSGHLRTLEKCRKHSPAARVFYISHVFSNARRVLSQCNTRLRLLYLLNMTPFSANGSARISIITWVIILINNYWMRLSMISWIIKPEVCVICRSRRVRQITQTRGFDNSWYHAKTEFNNCFITHFSHNSSSETEAKRSAILFLRRTLHLQQILHLSCQVHKLFSIDWMLSTNQIFHSESDV